jgi:hypothetical protein
VDVIHDRPLAICDASTIKRSDLVEADHVRKHYSGTNYYALSSPHYRWYYLSHQTKDEVTLVKIFDSSPGKMIGVLHVECLWYSSIELLNFKQEVCIPRSTTLTYRLESSHGRVSRLGLWSSHTLGENSSLCGRALQSTTERLVYNVERK